MRPGPRLSLDWSRPGDEDIHQPPGTFLPARAGGYISNTDKSPKKINRVKVLAYVTALDRALHECAKRVMYLGVGGFEHLLGVANQRIKHGSDDLFRFD